MMTAVNYLSVSLAVYRRPLPLACYAGYSVPLTHSLPLVSPRWGLASGKLYLAHSHGLDSALGVESPFPKTPALYSPAISERWYDTNHRKK